MHPSKENKLVIIFGIIASMGGFLFGFDTVVISGAEQTIQSLWNLSSTLHGLAISMALWGTVIGALFGGIPTDKLGRRKTMISIGILYFISAIGSALSTGIYLLMLFRFLGGLAIGISTITTPLYISEIAPPSFRGRLAGLFQFNIVFGILVAYLSNALLGSIENHSWRWMLGVEAIPAFLYVIFSIKLLESPRWLIIFKNDIDGGKEIFKKINTGLSISELDNLISKVIASVANDNIKMHIHNKNIIKPIILAFLIAFFNQLSGINAILYYAPRIFEMTGLEEQAALFQSIGIGITNLLFTIIGLWLIDRFGRKYLLILGSIGYIISLGLCSIAFQMELYKIVPNCIFSFIAAHAIGQGAVIWVFISEIFPNQFRATGQTIGSFTHWFFAASLTLIFPKLAETINPAFIFGGFCFLMILQLIWVKFMVPETKGISLEDMQKEIL